MLIVSPLRWWNPNDLHGTIMPQRSSYELGPGSFEDLERSSSRRPSARNQGSRQVSRSRGSHHGSHSRSRDPQLQQSGAPLHHSARIAAKVKSTGEHVTTPKKTQRRVRRNRELQAKCIQITQAWN